jgi:hypothetical protein
MAFPIPDRNYTRKISIVKLMEIITRHYLPTVCVVGAGMRVYMFLAGSATKSCN